MAGSVAALCGAPAAAARGFDDDDLVGAERQAGLARLFAAAVVVEKVFALIGAGREFRQPAAHTPLGIIEDRGEPSRHQLGPIALRQLTEALLADPERGELGVEVAAPLFRSAHIGED